MQKRQEVSIPEPFNQHESKWEATISYGLSTDTKRVRAKRLEHWAQTLLMGTASDFCLPIALRPPILILILHQVPDSTTASQAYVSTQEHTSWELPPAWLPSGNPVVGTVPNWNMPLTMFTKYSCFSLAPGLIRSGETTGAD